MCQALFVGFVSVETLLLSTPFAGVVPCAVFHGAVAVAATVGFIGFGARLILSVWDRLVPCLGPLRHARYMRSATLG